MPDQIELHTTTAQIGEADYVVTASGEVDGYSTPRLQAALDQFQQPETLVLDLRDVGFLDSTGIGAIAATAKRMRGHGGELWLVADSRELTALFQLTGLGRFLSIRPTLTAAIDGIAAAAA